MTRYFQIALFSLTAGLITTACSEHKAQTFPNEFYCAGLSVEQENRGTFTAGTKVQSEIEAVLKSEDVAASKRKALTVLRIHYPDESQAVLADYLDALKCQTLKNNTKLSVKEQVLALEAFEGVR